MTPASTPLTLAERQAEKIAQQDAEIKRLRRKIRQQKTSIKGQHTSIKTLKKELSNDRHNKHA